MTSLSLFTFMHWRRKWQPTPVFLPGESRGRGAWWAAVYGVARSRTRLKQLSSFAARTSQVVLVVKNPPANAGDVRDVNLTPGSGRCLGEGHGNPFQYFCLENPMERGTPWTGCSSWGCKESDITETTHTKALAKY